MRNKYLKTLVFIALITNMGTSTVLAKNSSLTISNISINDKLPSASGIDYNNGSIYAIGDDSPYLFKLDKNHNIIEKTLIKEYPIGEDGRIPKKIKPDFEAFEILKYRGKDNALILGSGSKDVRMLGYLINLNTNEKKEFNLEKLYNALREKAGFQVDTPLNVEGVTLAKENIVILNRGNSGDNIIFTINKNEFFKYIEGKTDKFKSIKSYKVLLPEIEGNIAGLSGVDYLKEEDAIILTASVEVTNDPINDGKILGSYVGIVEMDHLRADLDLRNNFNLIENKDGKYVTKAESITINTYKNDYVYGSIASDNDDGTSEFFNFKLEVD
ncbi:MAG: DUF6929 family protein [Clostridium sp.]